MFLVGSFENLNLTIGICTRYIEIYSKSDAEPVA